MRIIVTLILFAGLVQGLLSCITSESRVHEKVDISKENITAILMQHYLEDLDHFYTSLVKLSTIDNSANAKLDAFHDCRLAFKRIEFLLEYMDSERHSLLNGAPVIKEVPVVPAFNAKAPEGLQILEELLCNGDAEAIGAKEDELIYQCKLWRNYLDGIAIDKSDWMEAVLVNLIRIETLSLASFDQPCLSKMSAKPIPMEELVVAFESLEYITTSIYDDEVVQQRFRHISEMLAQAESLEDIPLAEFTRNEVQGLRKDIIKVWKSLQLDQVNEVIPQSSFDLTKASLYDPDFLDASFFSDYGLADSEDDRHAQKVSLGQRLFFDPLLSANKELSCGSCHQPAKFFGDGLVLSKSGIPGRNLQRNTPTLIHSGYQAAFMYDSRSPSLEDQMLHVFANELEFQTNSSRIISMLRQNSEYLEIFTLLYPEMMPGPVNLHSLTDALATYVRTLTGHNSPFDKYMRGEITSISGDILEGYQLFMTKAKCGTCHFPPTFSGLTPPYFKDSEMENIGVPVLDKNGGWIKDSDPGRYRFYEHEAFRHFFKTSTIRNAAETGPYMHNGVFSTLTEVMDFYNEGGGTGAGLDYPNQSLPADSLFLTVAEIDQIISFIGALTDPAYFNYTGPN